MSRPVFRILAIAVVVTVVLAVWLTAPVWQKADAPSRGALSTIPASQVLTEASIEALCRPPRDADTVRWDVRPFEKAELLLALKATPEGLRVGTIREIFLQLLARDPFDGECASVHGWVDRPLGIEEIERQIAASPEALRVAQVRRIFIETVGRNPSGWDNASLSRWVESGSTLAEIRVRLTGQRPLVGVHYFTWYRFAQNGWGNGATAIHAAAPQPTLGWYTSTDTAVIDTHIDQMADAGFDFVIVQLNADSPASWAAAHKFFGRLARRHLKAAVMLDGLHTAAGPIKARWVEKAKAEFAGHPYYFGLYGQPLIMLFSASLNFPMAGAVMRNVYWTPSYGPGTNTFNTDLILHPHDWPFWSDTPQPVVNGVAPVVPGYSDSHLGRPAPMDYPRNNGQMYHEQWQRALASRPELIIVYSWNEHFEQTAIEPTTTWGDRYRQWTACYTALAHSGVGGRCP